MPVTLLNPYCTEDEVRRELKNTDAAIADDIKAAINAASRWIDDYLKRDFFKHDHISSPLILDEYDGVEFGREIFLPYKPVLTLTAVTLAGVALVNGTDYAVKEYKLVNLNGDWKLSRPDRLLSLTGTFGYAQAATTDVPTGLPAKVNLAAILVAAALSGHNRKESIALDGSKVEVNDRAIPKLVFEMLGKRRPLLC